jgi:hypothetical protein
MNLFATVVFCNCAIAIVIFVVTLWTIQFRKQMVALTSWCDRKTSECEQLNATLESSLGANIAASSENIRALRQLYEQQLRTLDLIGSIGSMISFARYLSRSRKSSQRKAR